MGERTDVSIARIVEHEAVFLIWSGAFHEDIDFIVREMFSVIKLEPFDELFVSHWRLDIDQPVFENSFSYNHLSFKFLS